MATTDNDDDDDDSDMIMIVNQENQKHHKNFCQMMIGEVGKKYKKVVLLSQNTKTIHFPRRTTNMQIDRHESIEAFIRTNKIIKDHHENCLNVNRTTSTYSYVVRSKKKSIMLFTNSFLKTLRMGELNRYINGGKVLLKSFRGTKVNQLNHHTIPILEEINMTLLQTHVEINDLLKRIPNNVTVDSICNDILKLDYVSVIIILVRCLFQVTFTVPNLAMS